MNKVQHIAFVSNTSWSMYNFRLGVLRSIRRMGHQVYVIAPKDNYTDKLVAEKIRFIDIAIEKYGTSPSSDLRFIQRLWKIYKSHSFDYIFHYTIKPNIYGSIIAKRLGIRSISITTGLGRTFTFEYWTTQKIINLLYRRAARDCDQMWMLNTPDRERMIAEGIVEAHRTYILPSEGINTRRFRPSFKDNSQKIVRFLFAGRLLKDKGIIHFIEAARAIKKNKHHIKFEVLGFIDPKNPNSITHQQINQWQSDDIIKYLGSTEDVRPYIDRADCVVFPSFYQEGISRILLEAASMATPIITTDHVGCRDVVIDGHNGYLCLTRNTDDLIDKINRFLSLDRTAKIQMGLNGRALVKEKYDEEKIIEVYRNVIEHGLLPGNNDIRSDRSCRDITMLS